MTRLRVRLFSVLFVIFFLAKQTTAVTTESTTPSSTTTVTSTQSTIQTPKCGDNEMIDNCPVDCLSDYCPKSRYEDSNCPTPDKCSPPVCKCYFNYRRASNGTCIPTRSCPPFECKGENEVFDPCPSYCPGQSCSQATPDGKCHIFGFILMVVSCTPECRCKEKYWRLNGKCVPYSECPKENNTIEITTTKSTTSKPTTNCQTNDDSKSKTDCNNEEPKDDCGYDEQEYSDKSINECENTELCSDCGYDNTECSDCNDKDDNSDDSEYGCEDSGDDSTDTDETESEYDNCNKCCNDDEVSDCNKQTCGCEQTTQSTPTCGDNEVLDNCPVDCRSDYCPKNRHEDESPCPKPKNCPPPVCKCSFNHRRAENGTCISTDLCPPFKCDGYHEEYNACPKYCPGESCSSATPDGKCHIIGKILVVVECKPSCRCKEKYWRLNGNCVSYDECHNNGSKTSTTEITTTSGNGQTNPTTKKPESTSKHVCGEYEIMHDCPMDCPANYCPKSENDNQEPCPIPEKCPPPSCMCGFETRRAENGSCIPIQDCPPFNCSKPNEEYEACYPEFLNEDCSKVTDKPEDTESMLNYTCKPACRCKKNYWRLNGNCVPYDQCHQKKEEKEMPNSNNVKKQEKEIK